MEFIDQIDNISLPYLFKTNNNNFKLIIEKAIQISKFDTPVLIKGETGTGKEVFSKLIHSLSEKKHGPFIILSFPILNQNEPESLLFGYSKGSLVGSEIAQDDRMGIFENAQNGVLSIDELMDIPFSSQGKFSHFLDTKEFFPIGSTVSRKVDVRIIASTSKDLEIEVQEQRLREDTYFRLNVVSLSLPPLRERREDVMMLIDYFFDYYNKKFTTEMKYSKDCCKLFINYNWPGNIRELMNVVSSLIAINSDKKIIDIKDVKPLLRNTVLQKMKFKAVLNMPFEIRTAIKQYLNFFNDYLYISKGIKSSFEVISTDDGLELCSKANDQKEIEAINRYLMEYLDFVRKNISNISVYFEVERSETEKNLMLLSLKNEVQQLNFKLELKNYQMKTLEDNIEKFYNLLDAKYSNPAPQITNITNDISQTQNIDIDIKLEKINRTIESIKKELLKFDDSFIREHPDFVPELRSLEDKIGTYKSTESIGSEKSKRIFKALYKFLLKFDGKQKDIDGIVKSSEKWYAIISRIHHLYNGVASLFRLPIIP